MKKILLMVDNLDEGGVSKVLFDFLDNVDKKKYDITIMALYNNGIYKDKIKSYGRYRYCFNPPNEKDNSIKSRLYRKYWGGMLRLPESFMYKWFVKEKYDIEIAFMHGWSTKFISASNNKKSKKIAWVHVDLVTWNKVDGVFKSLEHHKNVYSKFNEVLCVSKTVKEGIENKYGVRNAKVLYNPIDRDKILKLSNEEVDINNDSNKIKLISVGRLSEQKGYDRLLRVFNKLNKEGFNIELTLVGSGEKYNELNNYIKENSLESSVSLLGYKHNPYKYVKSSDLFICSSLSEGFSLVIGEAMAMGIPVVSVDCPGPNELLGYGTYGKLVKNNEEELYKGIKELILDNDIYTKYKNKSIERGKMFSIKSFITNVESILDDN
ncbi:MAG: glycosyltransferase [Clostridium saudiense]|uniref:glycosyltransferase n=1 Tax=Clostridium saudiense TaxID=1414720 RepID=UPI00290BA494|nr:glycosyltransferase [Clostridium saudiense]MDU3520826.1 glycosyltransferase [Clostridium saudiense]